MITVAVLPGPNKPKNLDSFMLPIIDEIQQLSKYGMNVTIGPDVYHSHVVLFLAGGDIPGAAELSGHTSHNAYYGCRICKVHGHWLTNTIFFSPFDKNNNCRPVPVIRNKEDFANGDREHEQNVSVFATLSYFHGPFFFWTR